MIQPKKGNKIIENLFGNYEEMPKDWNFVKIDVCCKILDAKRVPINSDERKKMKGDIPYYGANGIQGYINKYIFDEDIVLLAEDGGNFDEYETKPIAQYVSGKSWVNNHAHVLINKPGYDLKYVYYSLVHKNIIPWIKGSTRSKLNQSELTEIEILMPPTLKEQEKISSFLYENDLTIKAEENYLKKLSLIKKGLMKELLTGKVRLNVKN